ncbi:MAG: signal peptidase II [Rickettsiales bacterium]|nr:signal peptidase II [Rickettsiales bacterium]
MLDQISKYWMLDIVRIAERPPIEVTSFFNLVMVWNHGVSFGMLSKPGTGVPVFLIGVAVIIVIAMLVWLFRNDNKLVALAIGLVVGGAIGNIIDRIRFGAVADFFDFHVMGWHWPAFNIADSGIVIGVGLLLYDNIMHHPKRVKNASQDDA